MFDLVRVFAQSSLNRRFHASRKRTSSTQVTSSLLRNTNVTVTRSRCTVHNLAGRSDAETLFGALMGLHFVGSHLTSITLKSRGPDGPKFRIRDSRAIGPNVKGLFRIESHVFPGKNGN